MQFQKGVAFGIQNPKRLSFWVMAGRGEPPFIPWLLKERSLPEEIAEDYGGHALVALALLLVLIAVKKVR